MARATQAQTLDKYRSRLKASKKWRDDGKYDLTWRRLKDLYGGKHFDGYSVEDRIAVNVSFATINVIYPSISVNHPKTTLYARKPDDVDKAIIAEAVLDYLWKSGEVGDEFRRSVKDFLIIGHGWVKTGYRYVTQQQKRPAADIQAETQALIDQANQAAAQSPELADSMPTNDEIAANVPDTESVVVEDRPFVERVSPHDIFVDPEATSMNDITWIAQKMCKPLEDVQNDQRYDAQARNNVGADMTAKWWDDGKKKSDDAKRVTVWEFYDLRAGVMCVFAEQGDGFLVKPMAIPYRLGHPFVMLRNYDIPDEFYPLGDLEAIEPLQRELNRTRSQLMNTRKQYARKILYKESAFGDAGRAALESDRDGQLVPVADDQINLGEIVAPMPTNAPPPELFNYSNLIEGDITNVSGVSDYQRGSLPEIRRTATEASMIQDAVNARASDKLAIVEKAIAHIGKNMLELCRQYLTGEQVARVVGKNGLPLWVPYTQEDIDCDCDFEVEGGSTMPKNEAWRQNQAMQLLTALVPFIGPVVDPQKFLTYVLQQFGIKNPEGFIAAAPPPPPGAPMAPPGVGGPQGAAPPGAGDGGQAAPAPPPIPPPPAGPPTAPPSHHFSPSGHPLDQMQMQLMAQQLASQMGAMRPPPFG